MDKDFLRGELDRLQQQSGRKIAAEIASSLLYGNEEQKASANKQIEELKRKSSELSDGSATEILAKIDAFTDLSQKKED